MNVFLSEKAPHLKPNSIKSYCSALNTLFKNIGYSGQIQDFSSKEFLPAILGHISTHSVKRKKLVLSALLILEKDNNQWKTLIQEAKLLDNQNEEKQELTTNQKNAWLDWEEIITLREQLANSTAHLWTKLNLSNAEYSLLQDYVIASVYTHIAPRRVLDYCCMRNGEPENSKENGIGYSENSKACFFFNVFKTSQTYGQQTIEIPSALWCILRDWMKINKNKWLFTYNDKPFRTDQFSRKLAKIFKKKGFGVNILRHAFVSDKVLDSMPFFDQIKNFSYQLGHSVMETLFYKKHK
jgi:hypothetical protein